MKAAPARPQLLTMLQAADRLSCSDDHVYRLIAAGVLRAVDVALPGAKRSKTRVREDDLVLYIDRQTRKAANAS